MSPELSKLQQLTYSICMPVCSAAFANRECRDDSSLRMTPLAPFQPPNKQYFITEFSRGEQPFDFRCDVICNSIAASSDYHHPLNVRKLREVFRSQFPGRCPNGVPVLVPDSLEESSEVKVPVDIISAASRTFISPERIDEPVIYSPFDRASYRVSDFAGTFRKNEKLILQTAQTTCNLLLGAVLLYLGFRGQMQLNIQSVEVNSSTQA